MNTLQQRLHLAPAVLPLQDAAVIAVTGRDAVDFLQNQLSNDIKTIKHGVTRLAGYCTAKGRLLATFVVWRDEETIYLRTTADLAAAIQKRLSMFVLRAKVTLTAAPLQGFGLAGRHAQDGLGEYFSLPETPYFSISNAFGHLVRLADVEQIPRYELWLDPLQAATLIHQLKQVPSLSTDEWSWLAIAGGIPQIVAATQEVFVPQMINLELVGGVSFKKGCYPGQEIVARSQYLGKLKRRSIRAQVAAPASAGQFVYAANNEREPVGMVVNAAAAPDQPGVWECLVSTTVASLEETTLHLGELVGPVLTPLTLPYSIHRDITA